MNILAISDTHTYHRDILASDLEGIDMIIHAGDISNVKQPYSNQVECLDFLEWYESLPIKYKILIAGNHDTSIEAKFIDLKKYPTITYLEHESTTIAGIKIFGSPYTPEFFNWAFNVRRDRLFNYWETIPEDTDILVTHGPPKSILDLAYKGNELEYCGDKALLTRVQKIKPTFHIFGHIHDNDDNINKGTRVIPGYSTTFINASCVTDGKFNLGLTSKGIKFTY